MALAWTDERYATGIQEVDDQHREMFRLANALVSALESGTPREEISARFDVLGRHAVTHFACEEGHMERLQCPSRVTNECAHEWFLRDFEALRARFEERVSYELLIEDVEEKVCAWLHKHLMAIDLVLRRFAESSAGQRDRG